MDIKDLGIMDYREALLFQQALLEKRLNGQAPDTLIMVEHFPVVTLGRLSVEADEFNKKYFEQKGVEIIRAGRGGKVTYHAPGQLVMYPIMDLAAKKKDISFYIDFLERTVAGSLKAFGVPAERGTKRGVWAMGKKIAFTGIAVKRWVVYHGVSVNINNDTEGFCQMRPCGDRGISVISAKEILGRALDMKEVRKVFAERFARDMEREYGIPGNMEKCSL